MRRKGFDFEWTKQAARLKQAASDAAAVAGSEAGDAAYCSVEESGA